MRAQEVFIQGGNRRVQAIAERVGGEKGCFSFSGWELYRVIRYRELRKKG